MIGVSTEGDEWLNSATCERGFSIRTVNMNAQLLVGRLPTFCSHDEDMKGPDIQSREQ
jgi:hypothetical protein